ncbi:hypothetical protein ACFL59_08290 [Planctomycetota bacterium]
MQTLTERVMELSPPGGLFDETVVCNLFPQHSRGGLRALVHRAVHKEEVLRLRPDIYCLARTYRRTHPHPFVVASVLHRPSQISFESALAFHGLIPEAVFEVASVTPRRSRTFDTPLGPYSFTRVPCNNLRAGVCALKVDDEGWACVATPLRALADLIYVRREVTWERDGLGFLLNSLRIEEDDLTTLRSERSDEIVASIRDRRTRTFLTRLGKELQR